MRPLQRRAAARGEPLLKPLPLPARCVAPPCPNTPRPCAGTFYPKWLGLGLTPAWARCGTARTGPVCPLSVRGDWEEAKQAGAPFNAMSFGSVQPTDFLSVRSGKR